MSKVISTVSHGDLLTSKANAHSLDRGDMITLERMGYTGAYRVINRSTKSNVISLILENLLNGRTVDYPVDINQPIDRVTGARSAGQIN